jgi:DNA-directed RNA polymerase subunit RPC12/RpoP
MNPPVVERTPVSVYVVPCPCGETIKSHDPNVTCPKCGRRIFVDWRNQAGMDNKK